MIHLVNVKINKKPDYTTIGFQKKYMNSVTISCNNYEILLNLVLKVNTLLPEAVTR